MTPQQANLPYFPFCGSTEIKDGSDGDKYMFAECQQCGATGPTELSRAAMITAWSRRAPAPTEPAVDRDAVAWAMFAENGYVRIWFGDYAAATRWAAANALDPAKLFALVASPASPAVPSGMMLVPTEPTKAMIDRAWLYGNPATDDAPDPVYAYKAMLAAVAGMPPGRAVPEPAPLAPKQPVSEQIARDCIDGAIARGRLGINPPPTPDHWLMEYWQIGQQLAKLGETSAWDNVTPAAPQVAQASQPTSTPEAVNLLVEQAKRVMGQDGGAEGGDGERLAGHRSDWYLMANCRRLLSRNYARKPNWVIACELFATGSTSAIAICKRAGIDPEATKIDRAAPQPQEQSK